MGYLYPGLSGRTTLKASIFLMAVCLNGLTIYPQSFKENFESGIRNDYWATEGLKSVTSSDYSISGKKSYRSYIPLKVHSNPRCEIRFRGANGTPNWHPHFSTWGVKFAVYIPKDFQPDPTSNEYLAQFHSVPDARDTYNNPPWALRLRGRKLSVTNRWIEKKIASNAHQHEKHWNLPGNVVPGKWHYFIVDIHWDYRSNGNGFMKFYMKVGSPPGKSDLKIKHIGPTGYNDHKGAYFKLGLYKWDWKSQLRVNWSKAAGVKYREVYYDDFEIKKNGFGPAAVTNKPPKADAGPDVTVNLPINSVKLIGTVSDPENKIKSIKWIQKSGPSGAKLDDADEEIAKVSRLKEGKYVFELQVTDDKGAKDQDRMVLEVEAPENEPPTAKAGPDITITLPTNSVTIEGDASDPNNNIKSHKWSQKSGPSTASLNDADELTVKISKLKEGRYVFELMVTDEDGEKDGDRVVINVEPPENLPPLAKAGPDITLTLPTNRVTVEGDVSDPDNNIKSIKWTQKSGPSTADLEDADKATVKISKLKEGRYAFELLVIDKDGEKDTDRVVINVEPPANLPPVAKAGPDITLTLPTNRVTVEGDASDPDNNIKSIKWTQKSGPSTANLEDADKATVEISKLKEGRYAFELLVTDKDGEKDADRVVINVEPPENLPPIAKAGPDINILLPINEVTIEADASDPENNIKTFKWTQKSGPSDADLQGTSTSTLTASDLVEGKYVFEFMVTDEHGEKDSDRVIVIVGVPENLPPNAHAGPNITMSMPTNSASIEGKGTDKDDGIDAYKWSQVSGPTEAQMSDPEKPTVEISNLQVGRYVFELQVTDKTGDSDDDRVVVTVLEAEPTISADITHATCNVTNGAISLNIEGGKAPFKYEWSHGDANSEIKDLAAGTYEVQVTDNHGRVLSKSFEVANESVDLQVSSEIKDATCGNQNGSIKVEVAGGEGPYNFEWSTNGRSANLNKLSAGSYDLIVSDQNGCSKKVSFEVGFDPQAINLDITSEITTASCAGKDGQIALTVNGNHGPLKFAWNHGDTGPVLGNLDVGKYQVTITDEHGCFMKSDYTVGQATLPDAPIISQLSDSLFVNQKNVQYQWYKDGQAITGANQQVLRIAEGGRYWVEVVNDQSCATASDYFFAKDPYTPLAGHSSIRQVEFYPNPAINDINVRLYLAEPAEAEISIYDFTGRILRTENLGTVYSSTTHKLSVQELPAGTYLIRAKADNEIVTRRFIKP